MTSSRFKCLLVVCIMLEHEKKILLMERANTGFGDGYYSFPGGSVESGEKITEAAVREAKEELGIDIQEKDLQLVYIEYEKGKEQRKDEMVIFLFKANCWSGQLCNAEPHKCSGLLWTDPNHLPKNILPETAVAIRKVMLKQDLSTNVIFSEVGWPS